MVYGLSWSQLPPSFLTFVSTLLSHGWVVVIYQGLHISYGGTLHYTIFGFCKGKGALKQKWAMHVNWDGSSSFNRSKRRCISQRDIRPLHLSNWLATRGDLISLYIKTCKWRRIPCFWLLFPSFISLTSYLFPLPKSRFIHARYQSVFSGSFLYL